MKLVLANEATAAQRRVYFDCRDVTDGITEENGEASGQPQISTNGGAWTNTGIGTLTLIGNGRYYADLTQAAVATAGDHIETRFKSANTAETPGDSVLVVAFDPFDAADLGLSNLDAAISSRSSHGDPDPGGLIDAAISSRSSHSAADVWTSGTRTLTSFGTLIADIWHHLLSSITTADTIGKLLKDNVDATISSRSSHGDPDPGGLLDAAVSSRSSHSAADVWSSATRTLTSFGTLVTDIWHHLLTAITTAGTIGKLLKDNVDATISSRSSHADPDLSNLDAAVSTRATQAQILDDATPFSGASIAAIKAKTDNLPESVKKNTALANFPFLMVLASDHVTGATGLSVTATRSIDGAAFGACANAVVEVANGVYKINLAAADLNGDTIVLRFTAATADDRFIILKTAA